jgi:phenylalanyl-tRNA synthetase alpha chain
VLDQLKEIEGRALEQLSRAASLEDLLALEQGFLGKKGELQLVLRGMGALSKEERPAVGAAANELKLRLEGALAERRSALQSAALARELADEGFDPTLPGPAPRMGLPSAGALHPMTLVVRELEDIFSSMGYTICDGPEVELEHYNFNALNIPQHHPARDTQDTFFVRHPRRGMENPSGRIADGASDLVLRTHTSPVQVRAMERFGPPLRIVAPGRVFRCEQVDASHEHTFYQMEGLVVDREISVAHLIHAMKTLLREIFRRDVEVRLRPGYFPFVEPGFELDARCLFCGGSGCPVCKHSGWIELLPCGLVHPEVLRAGGIDPEQWSGFAFGLGLSRLVMLRYGIRDIRLMTGGDLRFLQQFR